jgi:hypothetical protein
VVACESILILESLKTTAAGGHFLSETACPPR